ncbi:Guanylate cyclase soluble subunit beta [Fasciola hepatica]|uniref:guanylate cyclase n=1 Tax=Fasciola hepatica TaxID=6192 RepID=A0A4E0RZB4_FASHE|nr:Guanylate cyclase soluble subunit beta [Fasciola hepatica]
MVIQADSDTFDFELTRDYDEQLFPRLVTAATKVTNSTEDEIKYGCGKSLKSLFSYGEYQVVLRVLGRNLREFLNGLDNFHEVLRSTYPKIQAPSFFCLSESRSGITLQYVTKRPGFIPFFIGWMEQISLMYFQIETKISVVHIEKTGPITTNILRLHFTNDALPQEPEELPVPARVFFEAFPFNFVFNRGMILINVGISMKHALPGILRKKVNDVFELTRPHITLEWNDIVLHANNIFELITIEAKALCGEESEKTPDDSDSSRKGRLRMRGQMKYMVEWDAIAFLGTPIMENVDAMWEVGLFLNDLSMHDSSRDMVLAGEQQSAELKMALEQESEKGKRLEESLRRLDEEVRRTDELLYRMIPKAVAKRLRSGAQAMDTCETFPNITLLLSDVVGFTNICSGLSPLDVVDLLNRLYSCFDELTEKHKVYKVETIGDAYMIASGCPVRTKFHAPFIAEMALDMVSGVQEVKDNSKDPPESLRIRVGLHTGSAVAGVVGVKMPRYCLFGNTVSTAEVMEATSSDGATIQTYWLNGRPEVADCPKTAKLFVQLKKERELLADSNSTSNQSQAGEGWESVNASRGSSARTLASKRNSLNASARNSMGRMSIVLDSKFLNKRKSLAKLAEKTRGAV